MTHSIVNTIVKVRVFPLGFQHDYDPRLAMLTNGYDGYESSHRSVVGA